MEKGILLRQRFAFEFTRRGKERKSGTLLPKEMLRVPRVWVERHYNVTHWAVMPAPATSPPWSSPHCSPRIRGTSSVACGGRVFQPGFTGPTY